MVILSGVLHVAAPRSLKGTGGIVWFLKYLLVGSILFGWALWMNKDNNALPGYTRPAATEGAKP